MFKALGSHRPRFGVISAAFLVVFSVFAGACGDDGSGADDGGNGGNGEDATPSDRGAEEEQASGDGGGTEVEEIRVEVGDLTFDALAAGPEDGEAVLLLHGFPQTAEAFREQLTALAAAGYRAVAPDQRGYSPDARPPDVDDYRIPELVEDVVGIADALGVERFHLVGHDWGGMVAWQVAGRHPDRLETLTVLSTPHPTAFVAALGDEGSEQSQMSSYMDMIREPGSGERMLADDAGLLRAIFEVSGMPAGREEPYVEALSTPEALEAAANWYRAVDGSILDGLGPITMPTLYVWSTDDIALGRDAAEATADHVEGPYTFEVLDGVSHWVTEEEPDRVNELLLDHLASATD